MRKAVTANGRMGHMQSWCQDEFRGEEELADFIEDSAKAMVNCRKLWQFAFDIFAFLARNPKGLGVVVWLLALSIFLCCFLSFLYG